MFGRARHALVLLALTLTSMAHVGSPDTFYTGQAGPYPMRVSVRLPGVIPGLAQVSVRIPGTSPDAIRNVTVRAIQWNLGAEGAPPPDTAVAVPGEPELYAADLWLMVPTSYRLLVRVDGPQGTGTATVPVMALATAQREMPRALGVLLAGLCVFLGVGLLTIVSVAVRESVVPPGAAPDTTRRRRARIATTIGACLLLLAVLGGRAWWNAEAAAYAESVVYRPFASEAVVTSAGLSQVLTLTIRDRRWPPAGNTATRYNALMPDHGKLMHMFLIREPGPGGPEGLDAFAHVHPVPRSPAGDAFDVALPPMPAGRYRVYGDIVHESGYAQTLVAGATLGDPDSAATPRDPDDAWFAGPATPEAESATFSGPDGMTVTWRRGAPLVEAQERLLTFAARNADGSPAELEPYMGMLGHAAVASQDGSVFAHLHPAGSISMAALQKFEGGTATDPHASHRAISGSEVSIPYAFPKAGRYRVWIQVKRAGQIVTGAFDVEVR